MDIMARMKNNYEEPACHYLIRRTPVVIRVDGRAFHTLTRRLNKPFDAGFMQAMVSAAMRVAEDMQGFKMGYVQSDEASFVLTDYDTLRTEAWFGYRQNKLESITASLMTGHFERHFLGANSLACFDARAFNIPEAEVANYLLARAVDWRRNSMQMYAGSFFSSSALHFQGWTAKHEMLHSIGKNWTTDLSSREKNGTFLVKTEDGIDTVDTILPSYEAIGSWWDRVSPQT